VQREHLKIMVEYGWGQEHIKAAIPQKRCKIGPGLLRRTNRKSHTRFRLTPKSMTVDDLERPKRHSCRNMHAIVLNAYLLRDCLKLRIFFYPSVIWRPSFPMFPLEFNNLSLKLTVSKQESRATLWWKLHDPNFTDFDWSTRVSDGQTDRRMGDSIYAVARQKVKNTTNSTLIIKSARVASMSPGAALLDYYPYWINVRRSVWWAD